MFICCNTTKEHYCRQCVYCIKYNTTCTNRDNQKGNGEMVNCSNFLSFSCHKHAFIADCGQCTLLVLGIHSLHPLDRYGWHQNYLALLLTFETKSECTLPKTTL